MLFGIGISMQLKFSVSVSCNVQSCKLEGCMQLLRLSQRGFAVDGDTLDNYNYSLYMKTLKATTKLTLVHSTHA